VTLVDAQRERTIIVVGPRHVATATDPLPWHELAGCDAVYMTGGDAGAVRAARAANVAVATARVLPLLRTAAIELDALVGSDDDAAEAYAPGDLARVPRLSVRTQGARGGTFTVAGGAPQRYAPVPATVTGDTYGAGDTFAAALTLALGERRTAADAVAFAAARAAEVLAFRGPYPPVS
jgi:ribokinase